MAQKRKLPKNMKPATCTKCKTVNDPYPEDGLCRQCRSFLKGNPYTLQSEDMPGVEKRKSGRRQQIENRAKQYTTDAELKWSETPAITQDLAIRFATTKDRHDGELLLQQLDMLKARPKSSEDLVETEFSVVLTAKNVGALEQSLEVLDALTRTGN